MTDQIEAMQFVSDPGGITIDAAQQDSAGGAKLPRFSMTAYTGGPMVVGGFPPPVVVGLEGLAVPSQSRPIRLNHNANLGVGHTDTIKIDAGKLLATGIISRDTTHAREVVQSARNGFPWQASIGAAVRKSEFLKQDATVLVNGQTITGPAIIVRKATLGEISFVDLGADGNTSANVAAAARKENRMEDVSKNAVSETGQNNGQVEAASTVGKEADGASADSIRAAAVAETKRIESVRKVCNGKHAEIEAKAIGEGWDVTRTELEVLRAERPQAPAVHSTETVLSAKVLEAAAMLTGKAENVAEMYDERTLEAASKRFRGRIGLQELLMEAAWANGYSGRSFRDTREILRFAFSQNVQAAGVSYIDVSGILSNVANKFLLEGFNHVESTWRQIAAIRNVKDFKSVTSYRLTGALEYQQVGPTGELKHGQLGEESFTNKADTYGLMMSIIRQDIVNDDLGAITATPRKLGRGGALKLNSVFWTAFMANSAFFTVARKNYQAGADTALGIDGLTAAELLFLDQVDADSKPLGIVPALMLVPNALQVTANQLMSTLQISNPSTAKAPISNPHAGKFEVVRSSYLGNTGITGNSTKAWYLLASPADLAVIEIAFLNGQEAPTVETADADFNVLGVQMRGYHDFGVALQDYRAGVKMKGEA